MQVQFNVFGPSLLLLGFLGWQVRICDKATGNRLSESFRRTGRLKQSGLKLQTCSTLWLGICMTTFFKSWLGPWKEGLQRGSTGYQGSISMAYFFIWPLDVIANQTLFHSRFETPRGRDTSHRHGPVDNHCKWRPGESHKRHQWP